MVSGFRFDPPRVELSGELGWVLWRAFGPASVPWHRAGELRGESAVELAESLDLVERIAARTASHVLEDELGGEAAEAARKAHTLCAARALMVEQVCRELSGLAADLGIEVILLKGAALQLGGWIEVGSRSMGDVDVLVSTGWARRYQDGLIESGCHSPEAPEAEHQLQLLTHPTGLGIEVHRMIPGVRLTSWRSVTAEEIFDRGLCRLVDELGEGIFVPELPILVAHALVHGIAQHGQSPESYPWSRFLADVQDLGAGATGWGEILEEALPWIEREVAPDEVEAVLGLMGRLGGGEDPTAIAAGDDGPAKILRHLVAGAIDGDYVQSMRLSMRSRRVSDRSLWRRLAVDGWRTVWLTTTQVDQLYGRPNSKLGYWGWRLWRPFDLVGRAFKYGWASGRHRLRRR